MGGGEGARQGEGKGGGERRGAEGSGRSGAATAEVDCATLYAATSAGTPAQHRTRRRAAAVMVHVQRRAAGVEALVDGSCSCNSSREWRRVAHISCGGGGGQMCTAQHCLQLQLRCYMQHLVYACRLCFASPLALYADQACNGSCAVLSQLFSHGCSGRGWGGQKAPTSGVEHIRSICTV